MYNIYKAVYEKKPVVHKFVSIVGEIDEPKTLYLPIGMTVKEAIAKAGKVTVDNPVYIMGGPMMGTLGNDYTLITKTTNAIIILPPYHNLALGMNKNLSVERRKAASICCQCRACTDLCSRHMLGHPIEPHLVMRAVANHDVSDLTPYINSAYCSGCGICENFACPQSLSPKSIIQEFKLGLKKAGVKVEKLEPSPVEADRDYKLLSVHRLTARLGLHTYDVPAPFYEEEVKVERVKIPLSQHIGAPAKPVVKQGESIEQGQLIASAAEGLSTAIHSSIHGVVEKINEREIVIKNLCS